MREILNAGLDSSRALYKRPSSNNNKLLGPSLLVNSEKRAPSKPSRLRQMSEQMKKVDEWSRLRAVKEPKWYD